MKKKSIAALALAGTMALGLLSGCGQTADASTPTDNAEATPAVSAIASDELTSPKYVFLFIGDGMSYPQIQATADYLGALADDDYMQAEPSLDDNGGAVLDGPVALNFMNFEAAGSAVTYDSNSFAPDSASTATSISTGHKTYSGSINVDETGTVAYETISEKLHEQLGWEIGVISSVNLNHATPAAFYAHQASRGDYYEIGEELVASDFEYFAGGGLLDPDNGGESDSLYDLAEEAGYTVSFDYATHDAVTADDKVVLIDEYLADSDAMAYEIDRTDDMWSLADYVEKGIDVLMNDTGFFMMCEGGKIDWACHANDAASTIHDTLALTDAVQVAIDFAAEHPEETLIIVTADHETGGMTIGFATTAYDTHFNYLENQTISWVQFDDVINELRANEATFEDALAEIEKYYGLTTTEGQDLTLTEAEIESLKAAFELSMLPAEERVLGDEEALLYGGYEPLSMAVCHIINNKAGLSFTSYAHTGLQIPVYATGVGADNFAGLYDNTDIFTKTMTAMGLQADA